MISIGFYNQSSFTTMEGFSVYEESISRILFTSPGERLMNSEFGSKLKGYIFELDFIMQEEVDSEIRKSITRWEPRVNVIKIKTSRPDEKTFSLEITLEEKETRERFTFSKKVKL